MIGALGATPTICLQQHDCVATLIGKASSESEGARWGGVVPRIVLVVGVGVCVRITGVRFGFGSQQEPNSAVQPSMHSPT